MKPIRFYAMSETGVEQVPGPGDVPPTEAVYVECPFCPVLVPWNSTGRYDLGITRRRVVRDDEGGIRPLCQDCSEEVGEAEYLAEQEARGAWEARR